MYKFGACADLIGIGPDLYVGITVEYFREKESIIGL
jgi:hypothetical protein